MGLTAADVKTETFSRVSLLTGIGTAEVTAVTEYQGDKCAANQSTKMVGGLVGAVAGKPQSSVEITRLDKDVIWDLNPAKKTYAERPIALPTDRLHAEGQGGQSGQRSPYRIVKSDMKVTKTGQSKSINGFPCIEYLMTWEVVLEDTASKTQVTQVMTMDMWNTPLTDQLTQVQTAQADFGRKLAQKYGVELSPDETQRMGMGMFTSMYGLDPKEAAQKFDEADKELAKIEGYPVVTDIKWQVKGDSTAKKPEPEPAPQPSSGLSGMLAGKLAQSITPKQSSAAPDVVFSSYQELKSATVGGVPGGDFEIPAGYKKTGK